MLSTELWDTAGQEGFEQLRVLSYPGTQVYLVSFSYASLISLNNIEAKWMKEILRSRNDSNEDENPWIIMVGTKADIRDPSVTDVEVKKVAKKINACHLIATSAKNPDKDASGVSELLDTIMTLGFMIADEEERPNYGDFEDEPENPSNPDIPSQTLRASMTMPLEPVQPKKSVLTDPSGNVVVGPVQATPVAPCPAAKEAVKEPEAGCACVVS
jgi:small GTP-binding protein